MHRSEIPYPMISAGLASWKYLAWTRYGSANGFAWAIVAVVQLGPQDELLDWAAYWGGCDKTEHEMDAVRWVAAKGNKLTREDAAYFFPGLPIGRYRL